MQALRPVWQAPSDDPGMAEYLVEVGIDSMSLNPDSVRSVTRKVLELERQMAPAEAAT